MISREVTDLFVVTLSVTALAIITDSTLFKYDDLLFLNLSLIFLVLASYGHVVGRQMELINNKLSRLMSYTYLLSSLILFYSFLTYEFANEPGFWENLSLNLREFYLIIIFIIILASFLSIYAKIDENGLRAAQKA